MDGILQRFRPGCVYIWPGLARIWLHGAWSGLLAAGGFAVLLDFCLIAGFIWPEVLPPGIIVLLWCLTFVLWVLGWWDSKRFLTNQRAVSASDGQLDLFLAARGEYLRGEWRRSAELFGRILHANPRDVEARLMLATLMRHRNRIGEAREHLRRLQRLERAGHWNMEIEREWRHLRRMEATCDAGERTQVGRMERVKVPRAKAA